MEWELVGACIESEAALRTALQVLPVNPFQSKDKTFLHGVFYTLTGWLSIGRFDENENRSRLLGVMLRGGWPPEFSISPALDAEDRAIADAEALAELECPIPDVSEYIAQLCKQLAFPPLVLSPASQRSPGSGP